MTEEKYLGHMLVEAGLLDAYQVRSALGRQKKFGGRFASNVRALGFLSERTLVICLAKQLGVPGVDIGHSVVKLTNLDRIPREVCESHNVVPMRIAGNQLFLAMANPTDIAAADEIQFLTGLRIVEHVALHAAISDMLREAYALRADFSKEYYFGEDVSVSVPKDPLGYLEVLTGDSEMEGPAPDDAETAQEYDTPPIQAAGPELDLSDLTPAPEGDVVFDAPVSAPAGAAASRAPATEAQPASGAPVKARILAVDDEEEILVMIRRLLEKKGYGVVVARSGVEALEKIRSEKPDLILLDAMLPEVHGFEICQKIKASRTFADVPVIIVSAIYKGWRFKQDVRTLYGADGYVEKPFKIPDLLKEVERLLAGREQEQEGGADKEDVAESAKRAYQDGLKAYQNKDYPEAIERFTEAVRLSPLSSQLHFYLGNLYTQTSKLYEAINEYEKTIELAPQFFPALKNLALLYQKMGFRNKSLEMWERALRACDDDAMKDKIKKQIVQLL